MSNLIGKRGRRCKEVRYLENELSKMIRIAPKKINRGNEMASWERRCRVSSSMVLSILVCCAQKTTNYLKNSPGDSGARHDTEVGVRKEGEEGDCCGRGDQSDDSDIRCRRGDSEGVKKSKRKFQKLQKVSEVSRKFQKFHLNMTYPYLAQ